MEKSVLANVVAGRAGPRSRVRTLKDQPTAGDLASKVIQKCVENFPLAGGTSPRDPEFQDGSDDGTPIKDPH